ncbi:MAG: response regulator [Anaerolineales bacterium]|nr:response regulator [Anaerolineales bacterium]
MSTPLYAEVWLLFLLALDDLELIGEAQGNQEALRLCGEVKAHVVLMDLVMPEIAGAGATAAICQRCQDIQVIALTSFKEEELVHHAMKAGAVEYPLKNTSADELADAIRAAKAGRHTFAPEAAQTLILSSLYLIPHFCYPILVR